MRENTKVHSDVTLGVLVAIVEYEGPNAHLISYFFGQEHYFFKWECNFFRWEHNFFKWEHNFLRVNHSKK